MREILFRGKRTDNGEWVSGGSVVQFVDDGVRSFYMPQYNEKCTCTHDSLTDDILGFEDCRFYKVDGETICQYTGLKDKNGKTIFEGDYWIDEEGDILVVEFRNCQFCFVIYGYDDELFGFSEVGELDCDPLDYYYINKIEFAGNIHDNPELLKGEE